MPQKRISRKLKNLENRHFLIKKQGYTIALDFYNFWVKNFFYIKSTFSYVEFLEVYKGGRYLLLKIALGAANET